MCTSISYCNLQQICKIAQSKVHVYFRGALGSYSSPKNGGQRRKSSKKRRKARATAAPKRRQGAIFAPKTRPRGAKAAPKWCQSAAKAPFWRASGVAVAILGQLPSTTSQNHCFLMLCARAPTLARMLARSLTKSKLITDSLPPDPLISIFCFFLDLDFHFVFFICRFHWHQKRTPLS